MTDIKYRQASAADMEAVAEMLIEMHEEVGLFNLDVSKFVMELTHVIDEGMVLVAQDGDAIVGSIGIVQDKMWYSDDSYVTDRWFFVRKNYRKTRVAYKLLSLIHEYTKLHELPLVMGVMSPVDNVRKDGLFKSMRYLGGSFGSFPWEKESERAEGKKKVAASG